MYCARISGATFTADFSASEILLTQCSFGPWRRRSSKAPRTRGNINADCYCLFFARLAAHVRHADLNAKEGGIDEGLGTPNLPLLGPIKLTSRRVRSFRSAAIQGRSASAARAKALTTTYCLRNLAGQPARLRDMAGRLTFDRRPSAHRDVTFTDLRLIKTDSR